MGTATCDPQEFQIGFLDAEGALIHRVLVTAKTLTGATDSAMEIAKDMGAAEFFITPASNAAIKSHAIAPLSIAKLFAPLSRLIFTVVRLQRIQGD